MIVPTLLCWLEHVRAYYFGQAWMPDHQICTHTLKSKPEIYTVYLPSGSGKIQFSLALLLYFTNSTCPGKGVILAQGCWWLLWSKQNVKKLKMTETLANGDSSESSQRKLYPINTYKIGFRWFSKIFASLCFGRK